MGGRSKDRFDTLMEIRPSGADEPEYTRLYGKTYTGQLFRKSGFVAFTRVYNAVIKEGLL